MSPADIQQGVVSASQLLSVHLEVRHASLVNCVSMLTICNSNERANMKKTRKQLKLKDYLYCDIRADQGVFRIFLKELKTIL